ncbi:helix-turn-helix domain-containing protein [Citricoccus nitrophenolicus]|uniref:Helix-turn-helix domain-containing protein n=1 Tax=Citricoccus nitrophenolicus TaxID=863575 RepID=A0ABV0IF55_9MICC
MSIQALNWARQVGAQGVLRPAEVLLLWMMADHADEAWSCHPSQEKLARESNQSKRTVTSQIGRLRELGLISVENRYGQGRGRIGVRYYLYEDALSRLVDRATDNSSADVASRADVRDAEAASRKVTRDADISADSENAEITREASSASESLRRKSAHDSDANPGPAHLREHARINPHQNPHHHHGLPLSDPTGSGPDDEDDHDDRKVFRGVSLAQLCELVPELSQVESDYLPLVVEVVLDRATGRVAVPTRYVATALRADFEGVLAAAADRWPVHHRTEGVGRTTERSPSLTLAPAVACTNPDHDGIYDPADCPQCRLENRLAPPTAAEDVRQLSAEQIETLPASLRRRIGA